MVHTLLGLAKSDRWINSRLKGPRVQLEIRIMEYIVANPDACESATGVAQVWLGGEDPLIVLSAMQNLSNCGLLRRFGDGEHAVFYCDDVALLLAVLQMIKARQTTQPIAGMKA
jgi:hypothetical protein